MGEVVQFRGKLTERRGSDDIRPAGTAELLFFTGVRYEKLPEEPVAIEPQPLRRAKAGGATVLDPDPYSGRYSGH